MITMMQQTLLKHHGRYLKLFWTRTICSECCGSANFHNSMVWTHYPSTHQPSLAACPRTYFLRTGSYDLSIHPWHLSVLPTVVFHLCCRYDIQTMAASSTSHPTHRLEVLPICLSSLYSRQAGVFGFWCHSWFSGNESRWSEHITVPTRHYHMTRVTITIHHYRLGHLWSLQYLTLFRPR